MEITTREWQVLHLLSKGHTNSDIGKRLGISVNTVKFHLNNIYKKLNVSSRTQALAVHFKLKQQDNINA